MKISWQSLKKIFSVNRGHDTKRLSELEEKLGYCFKNPDHLKLSLVHRSYLSVSGENRIQTNERLEFLGDAALGLVVTGYLYEQFPEESEGVLTEYKSILVSRKTLGMIGRTIDIGKYLFLGSGEDRSGGRRRQSIISNAFEAVVGAVYLDGGFTAAKAVVHKLLLSQYKRILMRELDKNYKSQLLESTQAHGLGLPSYEVKTETGPEHRKVFEVAVRVRGKIMGIGRGKNKKMAEQNAAHDALENMNGEQKDH